MTDTTQQMHVSFSGTPQDVVASMRGFLLAANTPLAAEVGAADSGSAGETEKQKPKTTRKRKTAAEKAAEAEAKSESKADGAEPKDQDKEPADEKTAGTPIEDPDDELGLKDLGLSGEDLGLVVSVEDIAKAIQEYATLTSPSEAKKLMNDNEVTNIPSIEAEKRPAILEKINTAIAAAKAKNEG